MMLQITDETFEKFINTGVSVLLFSSPWCAACKKVHVHTMDMERDYGTVSFGTLDISTSPKTPANLQVFSIPVLIIFEDGREINRLSGAIAQTDIRRELDRLL